MAEATVAEHAGSTRRERAVSAGFIVLGAVLVGIGLTGMAYWLITFHWDLFPSSLVLLAGALILISRLSGPDHA